MEHGLISHFSYKLPDLLMALSISGGGEETSWLAAEASGPVNCFERWE